MLALLLLVPLVAASARPDSSLFSAQAAAILAGDNSPVVPPATVHIVPPAAGNRTDPEPRLHRRAPSFAYGSTPIRGVNLGGWLVLEPWITPSLFPTSDSRIVDEYTLAKYSDRSTLTAKLQRHWKSWITRADLQAIKAAGLNHVRIPIGYWAFDVSGGEPYVQGQFAYLKHGVSWAKSVGLNVIIDLHGAPGSQNGFDNSGRRGPIDWPYSSSNVARTRNAFSKLVAEFNKPAYGGAVTSIEALNEPGGFVDDGGQLVSVTRQYYYDSYGRLRQSTPNIALSVHDAFLPLSSWADAFPSSSFSSVLLDTHVYSVFEPDEVALSLSQRVQAYCNMRQGLARSDSHVLTYVGEWTPAPTDCAPRLNGQGKGARYDGTFPDSWHVGSCSAKSGTGKAFSASYKVQLRKLFEVQTSVYEGSASGWIMWTWKTEAAADWDYQRGLAGGWIPRDPTEKKYGNQCR